jgi:sporulation protein YlmC with PRC-barrel domain
MYISSIRQAGDVILVEDEDALDTVDIDAYSSLINSEVITETGEPLGRVRDFQFSLEDGKVASIVIASLGIPQIPDQVLSTYEISMEEVISSGPNRLIVFEGAEDRLRQLTVGLLERLGLGRAPWDREEEDDYSRPAAAPGNELPSGIPVRTPIEARKPLVVEERWDEDEWEQQPLSAPPPRRQAEALRYDEYEEELEEDNWGESRSDRGAPRYDDDNDDGDYDDVRGDVWDDDSEQETYKPAPLNIPEKKKEKQPEYEEETGY